MAPKQEKPDTYQLPHIRIDQFRRENSYSPPPRKIDGRGITRNNVTHGQALKRQLSTAYARAKAAIASKRNVGSRAPGFYLEITGAPNDTLGDLTWEQKGIRLGALRLDEQHIQRAAIFIPNTSEAFLSGKLDKYATPVEEGKNASLSERFDAVERLAEGKLTSLWTDTRSFPENQSDERWWECWTWIDLGSRFGRAATALKLRVSDRHLTFPEIRVNLVYCNVSQLEDLVYLSGAVEQIRFATDSPTFFTTTVRREQQAWIDDLRSRITGPGDTAPAVCLLDTGVTQAHPLLNLALSVEDCLTVNPAWGATDDDRIGHGTNMAGSVLYSDLTYPLADQREIGIDFKLESVKFIPPPGFQPTDPGNYGSITQAAVSTVEIHAPDRSRVFCMAVTNRDVSGERPTSWSAALDQAASGAMKADRDDENQLGPRRLFFVSGGNIPDSSDPDEISDPDEFPVEDPAQAWNVVTVGGFTDKVAIDAEDGYADWKPVAAAGELSPYSRISTDWEHSRTPIKPELVFEAGNKALSPDDSEVLSGIDSLSLLTTNREFTRGSLATFWATSPATAQAAGMAGVLSARFPNFWPETIRGLMVHSAEWTPPMFGRLQDANTKKQKVVLARHFGYGVPSLPRALASAENDLALIAERMLTPYHRQQKGNSEKASDLKQPSFKQIDYYDLPWPVTSLEELGEKEVALKVTLSYFIEPSPNWDASLAPQRYQSFGLRFDLKRASESERMFLERINSHERDGGPRIEAVADEGWTFGSKNIAAGSLHCDVWRGRAVDLAARGKIAIFPVGGWWRDRVKLKRYSSQTRYSLIVSITSDEQNIQLYSEVANLIAISAQI